MAYLYKDKTRSASERAEDLLSLMTVKEKVGEERTCTLSLQEEKLSVWNDKMEFSAEPGEFCLILYDGGKDIWSSSLYLEEG